MMKVGGKNSREFQDGQCQCDVGAMAGCSENLWKEILERAGPLGRLNDMR